MPRAATPSYVLPQVRREQKRQRWAAPRPESLLQVKPLLRLSLLDQPLLFCPMILHTSRMVAQHAPCFPCLSLCSFLLAVVQHSTRRVWPLRGRAEARDRRDLKPACMWLDLTDSSQLHDTPLQQAPRFQVCFKTWVPRAYCVVVVEQGAPSIMRIAIQ